MSAEEVEAVLQMSNSLIVAILDVFTV